MRDINSQHPSEATSNRPTHYVALGASAGGLESLQDFFHNLSSETGVAFIIIQHLSPDFKSVMSELLARCTSMNICTATDSMLIEPNCVYLIPPRKTMLIGEGKLLLSDQIPSDNIYFPIDIFFRSLAKDQFERAIGIILSGTGSDGSRGIQTIKEEGGFVMVQEPDSAKFNGMPYNAIKTGIVDVIDKPSNLPTKLIQLISHPLIKNEHNALEKITKGDNSTFNEILQYLKNHCDIDFSLYKPATTARRIERRISINNLNSLQSYLELIRQSPEEIASLSKEMLIGVTCFFVMITLLMN